MKKIAAALLALVMLLSVCCAAEEETGILDQAKNIISTVNFVVNENTGMDQLFVGYEEMAMDEIYVFYTEDNSIQALLVADVDENVIDSCSFVCDAPGAMALVLNCVSLMPFAQLIVYGDDDNADKLQKDMSDMADWIDKIHPDAKDAFENDVVFSASYADSDYFRMDMMIVPMDEGSRMMCVFYFGAAEAEEDK